jgi:hypothetical protein
MGSAGAGRPSMVAHPANNRQTQISADRMMKTSDPTFVF